MKLSICLLFLMLLLAVGCRKRKEQDPVLPSPTLLPITAEGKNTFGCMVNGELWLPKGTLTYYYYTWQDFPALYGTLSLRPERDNKNDHSSFLIQLHNRVFRTGKHYLYSNHNNSNYIRYAWNSINYENFANDSNNFIDLTRLDTVSRIASGTFRLMLLNVNDPKDTVRITDGRFDIQF
jgi:hypothetical protein